MRIARFLPILICVLFIIPSAKADDIVLVNLTATFNALTPCALTQCSQTFNISFQFDQTFNPAIAGFQSGVLPGTMFVDASGFLGQFTYSGFNSGQGYISFLNSFGDEFDLLAGSGGLIQFALGTAPPQGAVMYSCTSGPCAQAFPGVPGCCSRLRADSASMSVTAVPEPGFLDMAAAEIAIFALGGMIWLGRKKTFRRLARAKGGEAGPNAG